MEDLSLWTLLSVDVRGLDAAVWPVEGENIQIVVSGDRTFTPAWLPASLHYRYQI